MTGGWPSYQPSLIFYFCHQFLVNFFVNRDAVIYRVLIGKFPTNHQGLAWEKFSFKQRIPGSKTQCASLSSFLPEIWA